MFGAHSRKTPTPRTTHTGKLKAAAVQALEVGGGLDEMGEWNSPSGTAEPVEQCNSGTVEQWNTTKWKGAWKGQFNRGKRGRCGCAPLLLVEGASKIARLGWARVGHAAQAGKVQSQEEPGWTLTGPSRCPLAFWLPSRKPVEHATAKPKTSTRPCPAQEVRATTANTVPDAQHTNTDHANLYANKPPAISQDIHWYIHTYMFIRCTTQKLQQPP